MRPEFLCHLPFLRLAPGTDQALGAEARLVSLPFAEWLALEDPAMDYHDQRYEKVAPVFVRALLPEGGVPGELTADQERAAEELVEIAHTAAILALPTLALAPPGFSAAYVAWRGLPCDPPGEKGMFGPGTSEPVAPPDDDGIAFGRITVWLQQPPPGGGPVEQWVVQRRFGPAQREWLLSTYATRADVVSPEQVQAFARHFARVRQAGWGPRRAAAVRCADIITAMVTEGTALHEVIVTFVAAFENLVNAAAHRPLGDTFARRCAAWLAENPAERGRDQRHFRALYGARSDVLHGGDPGDVIRKIRAALDASTDRDVHAWLRLHAWLAVDRLVGWYGAHPDDDGAATQFQARLADAAAGDDESWRAKLAALQEGRSHARG